MNFIGKSFLDLLLSGCGSGLVLSIPLPRLMHKLDTLCSTMMNPVR